MKNTRVALVQVLVLLVLTGCITTPSGTQINNPTHDSVSADAEITRAEALGQLMSQAISGVDANSPHTEREQQVIEIGVNVLCGEPYTSFTIYDPVENTDNLYVLSLPPRDQGIQFGRHLRVRYHPNSTELIDVTPSTNTCITIPVSEQGIPYIAHVLTETPTEFHVFLSLYHQATIMVSAGQWVWEVNQGKISRVNQQ